MKDTKDTMSYEDWYREVSKIVLRTIGVTVDDLVDFSFRDAYDSGYDAEQAAIEAIMNDDTYSDFVS